MNEIFGISMNSIMVVLLVLLGVCLLSVIWVALTKRVIFKLGIRNIPRRKAQTVLIVIGLMLSTLIIAAALGTGDTIDHSATVATYRALGPADEFLVSAQPGTDDADISRALDLHIPESIVADLDQLASTSPDIDGIMPILIEQMPAVLIENNTPKLAEPQTIVIGIDPTRVETFGGLKSVDGTPIDIGAMPEANSIVISETLADSLDASVGSTITIFYANQPVVMTVYAIAEDSPLSGKVSPTLPGLALPLSRLQEITGRAGELTAVAISNRGDTRSGMELTETVTQQVLALFVGQPYGIDPVKQRNVEQAQLAASLFTTFFLIFGLFSIAVGILLIVLIFTMLAAERRSEMGMTRAVGAQRRQLIQQFLSEGSAYAILAGLVGAALGVLAAVAIALAVQPILADFLSIEPKVTPRSMVVAYCLGVVITFIAVLASSWKISRMNITAAVRDIPDVHNPVRRKRTLLWGFLLLLVGIAAAVPGLMTGNAFPLYAGLSLAPFGVALILRFIGVPSRPVFTLVGLYIVVLWLLPDSVAQKIFGSNDGGIEMFFLSGIFMVTGATILIVQNFDLYMRLLTLIGGVFRSKLPAVRTAVAFPSAAIGRTGMTIAMFSLIVFSLVMFATINRNFTNLFTGDEANAGWEVRTDTGSANPIGSTEQFVALLGEKGVATTPVVAAGQVSANFQVNMRRTDTQAWGWLPLVGMDDAFASESKVGFQQRAVGYDTDAAVIDAIMSGGNFVAVSANALAGGGFGGPPDLFRLEDPDGDGPEQALSASMTTFDPITVQIQGEDGTVQTATIIAVIDSKVSTLFGMYGSQTFTRTLYPTPSVISYFIRVDDPATAKPLAKQIETALITNGAQSTSIKDELEEAQKQSTGFLLIFQGFMGLGLIVGIAAVGVIAFRSVVERRQQIGVLRAIGFQRSLISLSFMLETGTIVMLGVLSGTVLGIALARNLFASSEFSGTEGVIFTIPWTIIVVILVVTTIAALLMTIIPARQASRLAPAEALRYE